MPRSIELVEDNNIKRKISRKLPVASLAAVALAITVPAVSGETIPHEITPPKKTPEALHETNFLTQLKEFNLVGLMIELRDVGQPHHNPDQHRPLTPAQKAEKLLTPEMKAAEENVHNCEEGGHGWHVDAGIQAEDLSTEEKKVTYPGGEGMSEENWEEAGGDRFSSEAEATPDEQMYIDYEWQKHVLHVIPDQDGCWVGGY